MTLRRQAHLAERALAQLDLAVAVGILPVDERDSDLGAVEQAGAHLVLDDAALGEHPDQVEIVDRKPGIAPDRGALEAGIGAVDLAAEDDVPVVIGEEELRAVLASDPPDSGEMRRLCIEMRPHGGGEDLGHGSRKGWREGEGRCRVPCARRYCPPCPWSCGQVRYLPKPSVCFNQHRGDQAEAEPWRSMPNNKNGGSRGRSPNSQPRSSSPMSPRTPSPRPIWAI